MFKLGGWSLALLLVGAATGLIVGTLAGAGGRMLISREAHIVIIRAGPNAQGCNADWSIEKGFGSRPSAFLDGGGALACGERAEPSSTFVIECICK